MIASFPMYDWPELASAHDAFWSLIRDQLRAIKHPAPERLNRDMGLWDAWESPDLILGQTCGMPYRQKLHEKVQLVGTPNYALPDAPAGYYYSELVVRADDPGYILDFKYKTLAFNGQDSQSGWAAPQNFACMHGFRFTQTLHTGAHRESALAVADRRADIAAIDAITWRLICRYLPEVAAKLRVLTHTTPTPGLPLISAKSRASEPLSIAVSEAIKMLPAKTRSTLGLQSLAAINAKEYLAVPTPPPPSQDTPQN